MISRQPVRQSGAGQRFGPDRRYFGRDCARQGGLGIGTMPGYLRDVMKGSNGLLGTENSEDCAGGRVGRRTDLYPAKSGRTFILEPHWVPLGEAGPPALLLAARG